MNSTVLGATKAMDRGSRQTRKERVAVVEAWQNEWGDQCYCSLGRKTLRDTSESAKLVVTGIGGLINAGFHGRTVVCCRGECRGFWRSESGTVLSSCWRLLTVRVGLCFLSQSGELFLRCSEPTLRTLQDIAACLRWETHHVQQSRGGWPLSQT